MQSHANELLAALPKTRVSADADHLAHLRQLGFDEDSVRAALESTSNNMERAIEFLLRAFRSEGELEETMKRITELASNGGDGPSTSNSNGEAPPSPIIDAVLRQARAEMETYKAYQRFNADLSQNDQEYLDLPLIQEEHILAEYRNLLEQ